VIKAMIVERKATVIAGTAPSTSPMPQTMPPIHKSARAAIFKAELLRSMLLSPAAFAATSY
jgi:hypothetical protein